MKSPSAQSRGRQLAAGCRPVPGPERLLGRPGAAREGLDNIPVLHNTRSAAQPDGRLRLGQTSLRPNPGQPPTRHSVKLVRPRLLVHHGLADKTILQIELQFIKPVRTLTSSLVISYQALMNLPYPVPPALGPALPPALG